MRTQCPALAPPADSQSSSSKLRIAPRARMYRPNLGLAVRAATSVQIFLCAFTLLCDQAQAQVSFNLPFPLNTTAISDTGEDFSPDVATDGAGNWVAVWHSDHGLDDQLGGDFDILVSLSSDNGTTWTPAVALNGNAPFDVAPDTNPRIATDGAGVWLAVWQSRDHMEPTIGGDDDIFVARSVDNGATWTDPIVVNNNAMIDGGNDERPEIAFNGANRWLIVWESDDYLLDTIGDDRDILLARSFDNGSTWTDPVPLNSNAPFDFGNDTNPAIATDENGAWVTVWESRETFFDILGSDRDILLSRSSDHGATWSDPEVLHASAETDEGDDKTPDVSTNGLGTWIATWAAEESKPDDFDILFARSVDQGLNWTDAAFLNTNATTDDRDDLMPLIAPSGIGIWIAVWQSSDTLGDTIGADRDIVFARSIDGGVTWAAPEPLNLNATNDGGDDGRVRVATDRMGNWVAVWDSEDDLGGTISTDQDIIVARSDDDALSWSPPMHLNHFARIDSAEDTNPQLANDGSNNWVAVWQMIDGPGGMDFDLFFTRSTDAGASWSSPLALNTNAFTDSGNDINPRLATNGAGLWIVVWESDDTLSGTIGGDSDILVARSTDDGLSWSDPMALNLNASLDNGDDANPFLAYDGAGTWVTVWESDEQFGGAFGNDLDVFFALSTNEGIDWTSPETLNTNASTDSGDDRTPQVAGDGQGAWVALWESNDDLSNTIDTDADILLALSADNAANWSDPVALNTNASTDGGDDQDPQLVTDAEGVWVAVWSSDEDLAGLLGNDTDILVSHSLDDGATWIDPHALNSNAADDSGSDETPHLATNGVGDWVTVWQTRDDLGGTLSSERDIVHALSATRGLSWTDQAPVDIRTRFINDPDRRPAVAGESSGLWIVVWDTPADLRGRFGNDDDLFVALGFHRTAVSPLIWRRLE